MLTNYHPRRCCSRWSCSSSPRRPSTGDARAAAGAAPGDYVCVSAGALSGRTGAVERLREDGTALVRLGGRLVVLPQEKLTVIDPPPEPSVEAPPPRKRPTRAL